MGKRIRADHEWYELRGAHVRTARKVHDCDMGNCLNWRSKIQVGDTYAWMSHGLNVCGDHFTPEDVTNGRDGVGDSAEAAESDGGAGDV